MDALTAYLAAPFASEGPDVVPRRHHSLSADAHTELAAYAATLSPRLPQTPSSPFVEPALPSPGRLVHLAPKLAPHQARPTAADAAALMAALQQQGQSPRSSGSAPPPTPVLQSAAAGNLLVNGGLPAPPGYVPESAYHFQPPPLACYPSEAPLPVPSGSFSAPPWQQSYHHVNYPTHYGDFQAPSIPQTHFGSSFHPGFSANCALMTNSCPLRGRDHRSRAQRFI